MSIHPGFPDLSPGRRRALCKTIDECIRWTDVVDAIIESQKSKLKSSQITHLQGMKVSLEKLIEKIKIQFPECRIERQYSSREVLDSTDIRKSIKAILSDVAIAAECQVSDIKEMF